MVENPLLRNWSTPHGAIPFDKISFENYEPAIDVTLKKAYDEINAICANEDTPAFDNVIKALEHSGDALDRVLNVFYPLLSANSNESMMKLSLKVSEKLSEFNTFVLLNETLWEKVEYVWEHRLSYNLNAEEKMLLYETYDNFASNGARLKSEGREEFRNIKAELGQLTTLFGQNVQRERNTYEIELDDSDCDGLPETVVAQLKENAVERRSEKPYLMTLEQPLYMAFMKYASNRALREKVYRLYNSCNTAGEFSNVDIVKRVVCLRSRLAKLLGYSTFADMKLRRTMAKTSAAVYRLLDNLAKSYRPKQLKEFDELKAFARQNFNFKEDLKPWDYSYLAHKLKAESYNVDEEELRPYFELSNTIKGVFGLANRLYGISFREASDIPVYHRDVKVYEVIDEDGSYLGILYADFFPRPSKRPGAWMTNFKEQWIDDEGNDSRPHVSIVMNLTKPTSDRPSCLTPTEVETFLHEFGHALHGLFARTKFKSLSGTNVYRDFVELPSQFNENFIRCKEFINSFAEHYITKEKMPEELIDRFLASSRFGAGYACLRQLNFGYLDMIWHNMTDTSDIDLVEIEKRATDGIEMFEPVGGTMISTQFSHIFSGGYAAGYYSYKWSEVLDADAFSVFEKEGYFNKNAAKRFRDNILSQGGTREPEILYAEFKGSEPTTDALLKRDGLMC